MGVFDEMYKKNLWGFGSGHGSLPKVTKSYRDFIELFVKENSVSSVVDFGCGDWQFSQLIDWSQASYTGVDIVESVIESNNSEFGSNKIKFVLSPKEFKKLPKADLLIVKDVLQHWPNSDIISFMKAVKPLYKFVITTNCIESEAPVNEDIVMGGFRGLDVRTSPFNIPGAVVHSFSGPKAISLKERATFPAWRKLVILIDQRQKK